LAGGSFIQPHREQPRNPTDLLPLVRTGRGFATGAPGWPTARPGGEGRTTGPGSPPGATRGAVPRLATSRNGTALDLATSSRSAATSARSADTSVRRS
jgi:hypothetical protein